MGLINEAMEQSYHDKKIEEAWNDESTEKMYEAAEQAAPLRFGELLPDMSFILAPTGEGSIEDYTDHVMNPNESKGVARILRGATGMLGQLNYAIIDIALGTMEVMKEGKQSHAEAPDREQ